MDSALSTGRSDPAALDLLGFDAQLVFSTFAPTQYLGDDVELSLRGDAVPTIVVSPTFAPRTRVCWRSRWSPWGPPELTLQAVVEALDFGYAAVHFPSRPLRHGTAPTHPDYHPVWALLAERDVPFMLHVGGAGRLIPREFHDNGIPVTDFLGGGENIRAKDYMAIFHMPEVFLSALIFDGVLERFPALRGGCIEQGALWVVPWLRRLDLAQAAFGRSERVLRDLPCPPVRIRTGPVVLHAFSGRTGRLDDRTGRRKAVLLQLGLPPSRRHQGSDRTVRCRVDGDAARRAGTVLRRQLRNHDERRHHGLDRTPRRRLFRRGACLIRRPVRARSAPRRHETNRSVADSPRP